LNKCDDITESKLTEREKINKKKITKELKKDLKETILNVSMSILDYNLDLVNRII
jgi:hypothetical protein